MTLRRKNTKLTTLVEKAGDLISISKKPHDYSVKEIAESWQIPLDRSLVLIERLEAKGMLVKASSRSAFWKDQRYCFAEKA